ncbi:ATP-binding protein [Nocardioides salsibiostraticola]
MRLIHLTAVGDSLPPASVEFAPRLTVIYGASETGKTYVIDALDFMLGGRELREVPEAAGYRLMLLGVELDDGQVLTLARDLRGGRVSVFDEDLRTLPSRLPDRDLLGQHQKDNPDTISHFFLDELGIADAKLRKNVRNQVQSMSLRNIAHLVLVDEERMQSRSTPVESGNPTSRTAERSAFKLLLEGEDDSDLTEADDAAAFRQVNQGQVEVLDRAIQQVRSQMVEAPEREECLDVLARVNAAIRLTSSSIGAQLVARDLLVNERTRLQEQRHLGVRQTGEISTLVDRFTLLDAQYAADLERLALVKEAGTLLGYFDTTACVFCGADAAHQQREHAVYETVQLAESVDAEVTKTRALRGDLTLTLGSVQAELDRRSDLLDEIDEATRAVDVELAQVDSTLQPVQSDLDALIGRHSQVERWIERWARVDELEELRADVAQERATPVDPVTHGITLASQQDFSRALRDLLIQWEVPGANETVFNFDGAPQIKVQQRRREDRGKGMRSILHAGFSVALSEFCTSRGLPHPGFVALDTPVLTYRDADSAGPHSIRPDASEVAARSVEGDDELLSGSVARAFYAYLSSDHPGQAIVLENQTPPVIDHADCTVEYFTGNPAMGRSGFYP